MTTKPLPSHAVRARRFFYGPTSTTSIAFVGSLQECKEFIRLDNSEVYHTSHNEAGRWTLRIVPTHSLSPFATQQAEQCAYDQQFSRR